MSSQNNRRSGYFSGEIKPLCFMLRFLSSDVFPWSFLFMPITRERHVEL